MQILSSKVERTLLEMALAAAPCEAVGLLCDELVIQLPNHAHIAEAKFEVHKSDIVAAVEEHKLDLGKVVFWHSHPSGGIGPSRFDMRQKTAFNDHLVVSLIDGSIVPSWY